MVAVKLTLTKGDLEVAEQVLAVMVVLEAAMATVILIGALEVALEVIQEMVEMEGFGKLAVGVVQLLVLAVLLEVDKTGLKRME